MAKFPSEPIFYLRSESTDKLRVWVRILDRLELRKRCWPVPHSAISTLDAQRLGRRSQLYQLSRRRGLFRYVILLEVERSKACDLGVGVGLDFFRQ